MKYILTILLSFILFLSLSAQSNTKVSRIHQLKLENKALEEEVILLEKKISDLKAQVYAKRTKQRSNRYVIYDLENQLYGVGNRLGIEKERNEWEEQERIEREKEEERKRIEAQKEAKRQKELAEKRAREEAERKKREEQEQQAAEARNRITGAHSGNQGYVSGDPKSRNRSGSGLGNSGNGFDLKGRSLVGSLPKPQHNSNKEGIVVIKIVVDRNGNVTSAEFQMKGSNTQDRELIDNAKAAARRAKFNADKAANAYAQGTITYHFQLD